MTQDTEPGSQMSGELQFCSFESNAGRNRLRLIWPPVITNTTIGTKKCDAARRAAAGIKVLCRTWQMVPNPSVGLYEDLELLFGAKDFAETCEKLITNSSPVLHFLPADNQPAEYSGVPEHSIALF